MANKNTEAVATIYAESLFELAFEKGQADAVQDLLQHLADLIRANSEFALFLESPAIANDSKKACLTKVFQGRVSDLFLDFLMVVAEKDRLNCLLDIQASFSRLADEQAGRVKGVLTTAVELSPKEHVRLSERIGRALKKTIHLETVVDPSIIGGLVLNIGDIMIDGSVQRGLERFKKQLRTKSFGQMDAQRIIVN